MKKRIISVAICIIMVIMLVASCGNGGTTPPPVQSSPGASSAPPATTGGGATPAPSVSAPPSGVNDGSYQTSAPEATQKVADHLQVALDVAVSVLNPFILAGNSNASLYTWFSTHDRLIVPLGDAGFGPQLAKTWETADGQSYVFHLRDDVYFHNGDHFSAKDVEFTINESRNYPGTVGYDRWSRVETVNIIDEYTIELVLDAVQVEWLATIAAATASIFNERNLRENPNDPNWTMIGTGPYKVVDFVTSDFITIERTDEYWGDDEYPTRMVTFRGIPEPASRLMALESGEIDVAFTLNPQDLSALKSNPNFAIHSVLTNLPHVLGFNMNDPLMSNLDFRLAVAHALKLDDIATVAAGEWASAPADGSLWGYAIPYRNTSLPVREYNPDLAKQYLAASPYNGETVELATSTDAYTRAAELIQVQLEEIGLKVNIAIMDSSALMERVSYENNQSQMHIFFLAFVATPVYSNYAVFYPGFFANRLSYDDPVVTNLIDTGFAEVDDDKRKALMFELQEYTYADPPAINLYYTLASFVSKAGVAGISWPPDTVYANFRGIYMVID